jgi:hypothetical protein
MKQIIESKRLAELEQKIERGMATFVEVGRALMEIRDSKLYLTTHRTFSDYCKSKWKFSIRFAQMQIAGARVAEGLCGANNCSPPILESQVRPLLTLPPEERSVTWIRANELSGGRQPTGRQVRDAVNETRRKLSGPLTPCWVVDGVNYPGGIDCPPPELAAALARKPLQPKITEAQRWEITRETIHCQLNEFYYELCGDGFNPSDVLGEIQKWLRAAQEEMNK